VRAGVGTSTATRPHEIFRGNILPEITSNYKSNDKCYTNGELLLYAPALRITADGPQPCVMQTEWVYVASRRLRLITSQLTVSGTRQSSITMPKVTRLWAYLCPLGPKRGTTWVYMTYGPSSMLAHRVSGQRPLNLHLWLLSVETLKSQVAPKQCNRNKEIEKLVACLWDRSFINLMCLKLRTTQT
jgi:hypothetical protein